MSPLPTWSRARNWILGLIVVISVGLDQWTKELVLGSFQVGESIPILSGYFNLTYVKNTGAAFGFLASADPAFRIPFFTIMPIFAIGAIAFIFRNISKNEIRMPIALSLVAGGALGNLIDRLRHGFVVDFLDFHWKYEVHFPAFNVADSAITVGAALMLLDVFLRKEA